MTTVALVFAAAGTSLAAVRAGRYEGGLTLTGPGPRASEAMGTGPGATASPADLPSAPGGTGPTGTAIDPTTGLPFVAPEGGGGSAGTGPGQDPSTRGATSPGTGSSGSDLKPTTGTTVSIPDPAGDPLPTIGPGNPATIPCPSDSGRGALPVRNGPLRAVNFSLPSPPVPGPVVLQPQASAIRPEGAQVKLAPGQGVAGDGSSIVMEGPGATEYTIDAGGKRARGTIRFGLPKGDVENLTRQACGDRSFALYEVGRRNGTHLRIVGHTAPTSTVTISGNGRTAHFRGDRGTHQVALLTAYDSGAAGPLVLATVTAS